MSSTNVSSLRIKIVGDAAGFEASLGTAGKAVTALAKDVESSATKISSASRAFNFGDKLGRELGKVRSQIQAVAGAYVSGGKVAQSEITALIAREQTLLRRVELRKTLLESMRGKYAEAPELRGAASYRADAGRTEEQKLARTRQLIAEVAAEQARSGKNREGQIARLIKLESSLNALIERRRSIEAGVRSSMFVGPMGSGAAAMRTPRGYEEQLARVNSLIREQSAIEVRTGQSRAEQIGRLIRLQASLTAAIERQGEVEARVRRGMLVGPVPGVSAAGGGGVQRDPRTAEAALSRINSLIQEQAAIEVRTGSSRAAQIERLIKLRSQYVAVIDREKSAIERVERSLFQGPMPAGASAASSSRSPKELADQLAQAERLQSRLSERLFSGGTVSAARLKLVNNTVRELRNELARTEIAANRFGGALNRVGSTSEGGFRQIAGGSNRAAFAITQLGFAAEDFLSQVGPMGIGGGLRAAGNNLSVVAASIAPMAGVFVGIGTALASIVIPKLLSATDAADDLSKSLHGLENLRFGLNLGEFDTPEVPGAGAGNDELRQSRTDFAKRIKEQERALANAREEFLFVIKRAAPLLPQGKQGLVGQLFDKGVNLRDPEFFKAFTNIEGEGVGASRRIGALFGSTGLGKIFGFTGQEFGPGVGDKEVAKELRGIAERAIEAGDALSKLRAAAASIPESKLSEFLAPARGFIQEAADDFMKGMAKHLAENKEFVTDFLGDIGGQPGRAAKANAALDKRLAGIAEFFPGADNAGKRAELIKAARALAKRDAAGETPGLAPGLQFGSKEAVSQLNRAIFSTKKADEETAKNTREAVNILTKIDQKLGNKDRGPALVAGPPIP